ncbi:MAG: hypothetical protein PUG71_10905 [bacterium]|nr:hypothetical protein [bacterium]
MKSSKAKEIVIMGMMTAASFAGQIAMSFLPNIEIVTLLFILYTLLLGKKVFLVIYAFVLLEGIFYGFGLWWLNYLYIWTILAIVVLIFRNQQSVWFWSIVSGFYGLSYGALCSIIYLFIGGINTAFAYWVSGLGFDVIHCIGNVVVCLILYKPLRYVLEKCMNM